MAYINSKFSSILPIDAPGSGGSRRRKRGRVEIPSSYISRSLNLGHGTSNNIPNVASPFYMPSSPSYMPSSPYHADSLNLRHSSSSSSSPVEIVSSTSADGTGSSSEENGTVSNGSNQNEIQLINNVQSNKEDEIIDLTDDLTDESGEEKEKIEPDQKEAKLPDRFKSSKKVSKVVQEEEEGSPKLRELLRKALVCPVCMDPCKDITSTYCGHIYCRDCIVGAINKYHTCPLCTEKLTLHMIHPLFF